MGVHSRKFDHSKLSKTEARRDAHVTLMQEHPRGLEAKDSLPDDWPESEESVFGMLAGVRIRLTGIPRQGLPAAC